MDKIIVESTIYLDTLSLLLSEKTDIRAEVENQLNQSDYETEQLLDGIINELDADESVTEEVEEAFSPLSSEELMKFIKIDESKIEFDYEESMNSRDRRIAAFRVPLEFDTERFWKQINC